MEYEVGNGTDYSYGPLTIIGYAIFLVYCLISMFILIFYKREFEKRIWRSLIPMIVAMMIAVIVQAFIPELLMTGGGLTFICIGMFVSLDNPDKDFRRHALWDFLTGLKNQNSYKRDLSLHKNRSKFNRKEQQIAFVVADLNNLKLINDNYGHDEGDRLISAAAAALKNNLKSASDVYRFGGDEFAAIYINVKNEIIEQEIQNVRDSASQEDSFAVPLSIAIGYASGVLNENANDIFKIADKKMYKDKEKIKHTNKIFITDNIE